MNTKSIKDARMEIRMKESEKKLIIKAAGLKGEKASGFVIKSVLREAKETIENHQKILHSERDKKMFFDALLMSPEPNEALRKAADKYGTLLQ